VWRSIASVLKCRRRINGIGGEADRRMKERKRKRTRESERKRIRE